MASGDSLVVQDALWQRGFGPPACPDFAHRPAVGVDDVQRAEAALQGVVGKRLTYRRVGLGSEA
jgi:hypothetical protein